MAEGCLRFDRFVLDAGDRRLLRDGEIVELNSRYLDALILLASDPGRLVTKEHFLAEVWRGIPVTDEALTQCIRTLRRQLGDDAAHPRLIETVPKHGYRFVASVSSTAGPAATRAIGRPPPSPATLAFAGPIGGAAAGLVGGMFYGFAATSRPPGEGAISVLLVLLCVTVAVALLGAAGVCAGIAAARRGGRGPSAWDVAGGAAGGLVVGALVKLVGLDAFALLFGHAPRAMTGAPEGLLLGGAVGLGAWATARWPGRESLAFAALAGGAAGIVAVLLGGHLFGGSLASLAQGFPGSRLSLSGVGALVGEREFGPLSSVITAGLEGALFAGGIAAGLRLAARR